MHSYPEGASFVFIDDAHTFGGTQIALAWTIDALLQETRASVLCICTARTRKAVEEVVGPSPRLQFERAPAALPLNLFRFPQRLLPWWRLLRRIRSQGERVWWLNLADLEFGLAPLLTLRAMEEYPHAYLHGTAASSFSYRSASWKRRLMSRVRDAVANRFVLPMHRCLVVPSRSSQLDVESRVLGNKRPWLGHLYYPPIGDRSRISVPPSALQHDSQAPIAIWMIGSVLQGHKNNRAALEVLDVLDRQGFPSTLTIAGVGPDLQQFKKEAAERGLADRITYLGWVSEPCRLVPKDAMILIPSFHETMNIVAREAMRHGLRLIASPIPVFREWIPAPLIAETFAPEAFAAKLLEVRKISAQDMARLYQGALAQFSHKQFIESFLAISASRPGMRNK